MITEKRYYSVECKCGHVGAKKFYIPIKFAIMANNGKEAAAIGRQMPRCKHHHKDCVLNVEEITFDEYKKLSDINYEDPYLRCACIQDQYLLDLTDRLVEESNYDDMEEYEEQIHILYEGKTKVRRPKKFYRLYNYDYDLEECC